MSDPNTSSEQTPTFIDVFWHQLESSIAFRAEKRLSAFVRQRNVKKWIIATDFCIRDRTQPVDAFAFVVMPAAEHFEETKRLVSGIPRDLKNVSRIPQPLSRLLRKGRVFTFGFAADQARRLYTTPEIARQNIDETIAMMERWEDADRQQDLISAVRRMRIEADKKNISLRLLEDIVVIAAITSYIAYLICKYSQAEMIGWTPDRDKITEAYHGIAVTMFHINLSVLCQRKGANYPMTSFFTQRNDDLWLDPFVRTADYVAGAVAAWDPPANSAVPPKIADIIRNIFADNRYLFIFRIAYFRSITTSTCEVRGVNMSASPPGPHQQGRRPLFKGVEALQGRSRKL